MDLYGTVDGPVLNLNLYLKLCDALYKIVLSFSVKLCDVFNIVLDWPVDGPAVFFN